MQKQTTTVKLESPSIYGWGVSSTLSSTSKVVIKATAINRYPTIREIGKPSTAQCNERTLHPIFTIGAFRKLGAVSSEMLTSVN